MVLLYLAWVRVFISTLPQYPDKLLHVNAPFGLSGTDVERPPMMRMAVYVYW
jgi:hypothetical protein